ncbi:ABC transporter ATP-binding protein [Subtercola sp. YIM 133946]|uniref:ABC transporter ATP-binding protein n=1 Tax=Subtercola sp. YIM 133946 TaxID=3118909 RepID=UPI002F92D03B
MGESPGGASATGASAGTSGARATPRAPSDTATSTPASPATPGAGAATPTSAALDRLIVAEASKSYGRPGARRAALAPVDLSIERGQFVSIIGPSGCGKSTLLRLMAGLEHPDSGSVSLFGRSPAEAAASKSIAFMPQVAALLPWSNVLENVKLPSKVNRRADARRHPRAGDPREGDPRAGEPGARESSAGAPRPAAADPVALLTELGLGDSLRALPHELSGGMQQRVAIARAFATQADVLLMDEPFSALDEFTREATQDQLLLLWQKLRTTVVFVTHSVPEAVVLSDVVVVMSPRPGRIASVVPIDAPRPRRHGLVEAQVLHDYEDLIRAELQAAGAA